MGYRMKTITVARLREAIAKLDPNTTVVIQDLNREVPQYNGVDRMYVAEHVTVDPKTYLTAQGTAEAREDKEKVRKLPKPVFVIDLGD